MAAKQLPQSEPTLDVSTYNVAMEALAAADAELVAAKQRIADMETRATTLGSEAAELEKQRGIALARGELDQAADLGKKFAVASDGAKEAGRAARAMSGAMDDLWINILEAESEAFRHHNTVMSAFYESQRAALFSELRARVFGVWRAGLSSGTGLPFSEWWSALGQDVDVGNGAINVPAEFPVPEMIPRSQHLAGSPMRGSSRRADIAFLRDAKLRAAQAEALGGQAA